MLRKFFSASGYRRRSEWKAVPVSETASLIADALDGVAAAFCQCAAGMHTTTPGDQRQFAAVLYADAIQRFADVSRKLDARKQAELENYITQLCKGKR